MGSNILYIEDNPDNMMLVKRALESRGYTLLEARSGLDGVVAAEKNELDLILLDINLPDIDGYEVARRLRGSVKPTLANHAKYPGPLGRSPARLPATIWHWRSQIFLGTPYGWIETTSGCAAIFATPSAGSGTMTLT